MNTILHLNKKMKFKHKLFYIGVFLCFMASHIFVTNNYSFYERPIAKVIEMNVEDQTEVIDAFGNKDLLFTQHIIAELKNGEQKGSRIHLVNEYSSSKAYDYEFHVGNEIFVTIDVINQDDTDLTGNFVEVKRDKYLMFVAWMFIFILLLVGKKQGLFSIFSLIINAVILSYALDLYLIKPDRSLLLICSIGIILFTVLSLLLVNGFNEKTYSAIVATLIGTFVSLAIAYLVLWETSGKGLRFEELQFITRPYKTIFMAGLFIGSLGAVMDVAITMSSTIFGLYEKNNKISVKALVKSGMEVGKDIMGTMTNILFFAYISGSIPLLILYFKNASPLGFTLNVNLSLELARALAGGIGIALTIPIGLYTTIFFVSRKRARS